MKVDRTIGWEENGLDNEIKFIKKLKKLLINYSPIFVTWNNLFYEQTNQFTDLVEVSTLEDEGGDGETNGDWHPAKKRMLRYL